MSSCGFCHARRYEHNTKGIADTDVAALRVGLIRYGEVGRLFGAARRYGVEREVPTIEQGRQCNSARPRSACLRRVSRGRSLGRRLARQSMRRAECSQPATLRVALRFEARASPTPVGSGARSLLWLHCGRACNPPRTHQPSAVTIASLFDIATSSCTYGKCVCESMNHLAKYARSGRTSTDVADQ